MESNKSAVLARSLTGIICDVRIRRSAGEHRTRLTSANRQRRQHWLPDAMPRRCREFVDSRLRRSPPDRASAVPYGQAGENAMRFPHLAHRSAAAHKLHSTTATTRYEFDSGKGETFSRHTSLSLFSPEAVQTTGTVATFVRLSDAHLHEIDLALLPQCSPPRLFTAAAWSGLGSVPENRSGGANPHLSRSLSTRLVSPR